MVAHAYVILGGAYYNSSRSRLICPLLKVSLVNQTLFLRRALIDCRSISALRRNRVWFTRLVKGKTLNLCDVMYEYVTMLLKSLDH